MSWDEYEALGPSVRGEYIDGELVTSPFTFDPADLSACSEPGNGDSKRER